MSEKHSESEALIGQRIGSSRFIIDKYVTGGSFGSFHHGYDRDNREKVVAVKLEKMNLPQPQLHLEFGFYRIMGAARFIPKIHYIGPVNDWNALVMELLGPSLYSMMNKCDGAFSISCATKIFIQLINLFEFVHDFGLIYRDIKPENFLLGPPNTNKWCTVCLIDLGFCKKYIDENNYHIPMKNGKPMTGTARYISINNHNGIELSRRDDLEAILYMIVFLHKGELPWQGVQTADIKDKYKKIGAVKKQITPAQLCSNMPSEYVEFFEYVRNLRYEQRPNYSKQRASFRSTLTTLGTCMEMLTYDWDEAQNAKPAEKRF